VLNKLLQKLAIALHIASLKLFGLSDKNRAYVKIKSQRSPFSQQVPISIVITTFAARFHLSLPLIENLRSARVTTPIYVLINADNENLFDHSERSKFISDISKYPSVFPISIGRKLGMSALWNTGIRCSDAEHILLLNDDLSCNPNSVLQTIEKLFELVEQNGLVTLNGGFSHFAISRKCTSDVGWFDEHFLGFGEEDGDYIWRYEDFYGIRPINIQMNGLLSHSSDIGYEQIRSNELNKYSLFNTEYLLRKYSFSDGGHKGPFGKEAKKVLPEVNPYPLDNFYDEFGYCLDEESKEVVGLALDKYFGNKF